jgi:FixJ family two-component response regulator
VTTTPASVFVVDDDASVRRGLRRLLSAAGYEVWTFASGHELLEHLPLTPPSCFVLDVRMPGQSGTALYEALVEAGYRSPVLFITGDGDVPSLKGMSTDPCVGVLAKPVSDDELFAAVHRLILAATASAKIS